MSRMGNPATRCTNIHPKPHPLTMSYADLWLNGSTLKVLSLLSPSGSQDAEPHAGPGPELRGGPGLHHGADHLRLLPQLGGGAELRRQSAWGGHHAALQTRTALPGTPPQGPALASLWAPLAPPGPALQGVLRGKGTLMLTYPGRGRVGGHTSKPWSGTTWIFVFDLYPSECTFSHGTREIAKM